jgi:hypothetical protein
VALALMFRYHMPEPLFDKRFQCCLLTLSQLPGLFKKTIWYLYGCLHMANHIISYGMMSSISSSVSRTSAPLNYYLGGSYKKFFLHVRKCRRAMLQLLENSLPVSYIMDAVKGPRVIKLGSMNKAGNERDYLDKRT